MELGNETASPVAKTFRRLLKWLPPRLRGHAVRFAHRLILPSDAYLDDCFGAPFEYRPGYGEACLFFGLYEAADRQLIQPALRPGVVAVDIGANIGWYSAVFLGAAGPRGQVIAVEPLPENLSRIHRMTKIWSQPSNFSLISAACGSAEGRTKLYLNKWHPGNTIVESTTRNHPAFDGATIDVDVITVDDILDRYSLQKVDLLKIDVEGAELLVLKGAEEALRSRKIRSLFVEVTDRPDGDGSSVASEVHRLLTSSGYRGWITENRKVLELCGEKSLLHRQKNVLYSIDDAVSLALCNGN